MAVLRYHRVADLESDPFGLAVSVGRFEQHLAMIRANFAPVAGAMFDDPREIPLGAVALTFDDGYHDFASTVRPLLARYQVPATVFVTTDSLARPREFWWDRVARLCLDRGSLPTQLELRIGPNRTIRVDLGRFDRYASEDLGRYRGWNIRSPDDPTGRHRLLRVLYRALQPLDHGERERLIEQIERWAGAPAGLPVARRLGEDELVVLSRDPLVEIGGHSVTHPLFRGLDRSRQWQEISDCKASLDRLLRRPTRSFAYPYGAAGGAARLVREAGFAIAFSTAEAAVSGWNDRFRLPRIQVFDEDAEHLDRRLRGLVGS